MPSFEDIFDRLLDDDPTEGDPLDILKICEDDYPRQQMTESSVVCSRVWGTDRWLAEIKPVIDSLNIPVSSVGLRDEGITVTFGSVEAAVLFRMFFKGDTLTT